MGAQECRKVADKPSRGSGRDFSQFVSLHRKAEGAPTYMGDAGGAHRCVACVCRRGKISSDQAKPTSTKRNQQLPTGYNKQSKATTPKMRTPMLTAMLLLASTQHAAALQPARATPTSSRRAALASALPLASTILAQPVPAFAAGNTCARDDEECLLTARQEAQAAIRENSGGLVGVVALLIIRGINAPSSGLAIAQKKLREEKLKAKK